MLDTLCIMMILYPSDLSTFMTVIMSSQKPEWKHASFIWEFSLVPRPHIAHTRRRVRGLGLSTRLMRILHETSSFVYHTFPSLGRAWVSPTLAGLHCACRCACLSVCLRPCIYCKVLINTSSIFYEFFFVFYWFMQLWKGQSNLQLNAIGRASPKIQN